MFDTEEGLIEMRVKLFLANGLLLIGVVVVAANAEEVNAVDLETPLRRMLGSGKRSSAERKVNVADKTERRNYGEAYTHPADELTRLHAAEIAIHAPS